MIAKDAQSLVSKELFPAEELLWADRPRSAPKGIFLFLAFIIIFLGGFFIGPLGYALVTQDMSFFDGYNFSINGRQVTSETPISTLWPAFVSSLAMLTIFIAYALSWLVVRMRDVYAITGGRGIIVTRFFGRRVSSINFALFPIIERSGGEKIGSLTFTGAEHGIVDKFLSLYRVRLNRFTNIRKPQAVEALIRERFIDVD